MSTTLSTLVREGLHLRARATAGCAIRRLASTVPSPSGPPDDDGQYNPFIYIINAEPCIKLLPPFRKRKWTENAQSPGVSFAGLSRPYVVFFFFAIFIFYHRTSHTNRFLPKRYLTIFSKSRQIWAICLSWIRWLLEYIVFKMISNPDLRILFHQAQSARWQDTPWKKRNECIPVVCRGAFS